MQTTIKLKDTFTLAFGVVINMVTLYSLDVTSYNLQNFKIYNLGSTWTRIGIITAIFGVLAWQYRLYGARWLKNSITDGISFILGSFFIVLGIVTFGNLINLQSLYLCQKKIPCVVGVILGKIFYGLLIWFFGYAGIKLINIKNRRYSKRK